MNGNVENLILEHLRNLRGELAATREDVRNITVRLGNVERGIALLHQDNANIRNIVAEQGVRLDRLDGRVERIEHRLNLANG